MDVPRMRGRPKGSKDGPSPPGAPKRGRPSTKTNPNVNPESSTVSLHSKGGPADFDADDEYDFDDDGNVDVHEWETLDQNIQEVYSSTRTTTPEPPANNPSFQQLRAAARHSQKRPFFTQSAHFSLNGDDDSDPDLESQDDGDENPETENNHPAAGSSWFRQPKYMPDWLYRYFHKFIRPMITQKDNRGFLLKPSVFTSVLPSFWVHPPEPTFALSEYKFDPSLIYRPRVFLWLPHFFVEQLSCPNCGHKLEKNGALTPRRIVDVDSNFYLVSWAYYCRNSCKSHYHGWSKKLIDSLPPYLQLAFPAILSQQSGVSRNVMNPLRVGNQHKMGPSGVRSLLLESHTLRFNTLQAQYLEAVIEMVRCRQIGQTAQLQTNLDSFLTEKIPDFGDFGDSNGYSGFVPIERYLASMLTRPSKRTSLMQINILRAKINKHIASVDGKSIFGALWTCMDSRGIRAQALTLTKSHEERIGPLKGIAKSVKLYGFDNPLVVFTDDPMKDKRLIYDAFPSLAKNLAPPPSPRGLEPFEIPESVRIQEVLSAELADNIFSSFTELLDSDAATHICISLEAEWNVSRTTGVSILQIAPHAEDTIFIVPVHRFKSLPTSLLRLLISDRVFKIGSHIKADLTRLQKQFSQLKNETSFNVIDLKEYSIQRGVIGRKDAGGLDTLVEKVLGKYLSKDPEIRRCEEWEAKKLHPDLQKYAALDVFASRMVFEQVTHIAPLDRVQHNTAAGTRVALLIQEGGEIAAYGKISAVQTSSFGGMAAVLHLLPQAADSSSRRTKAGSYTLGQLNELAGHFEPTFSVVSPVHLLKFDHRHSSERCRQNGDSVPALTGSTLAHSPELHSLTQHDSNESDQETDTENILHREEQPNEDIHIGMLEAHAAVVKGKRREPDAPADLLPLAYGDVDANIVATLRKIVDSESTSVPDAELTRIKKDIWHAFHMLALKDHPLRASFCVALRDHTAIISCDGILPHHFGISFEVSMLSRHPDYIKRRTPRYVPPPRSVIVPAIEHIFNSYGNALDAQSGSPLFSEKTWQKANAVLELARQGYLSDIQGVPMYEKAGVDNHGLQKYDCKRGSNKVEGGPHGDIYRKFGALNAGPRLTVNCLTDHRVWYNLQAYAKHVHRAESYSEWLNPDLYERATEKFGICPIPDSLRLRLHMEPYNDQTAARFKLKSSDDWLRRRPAVALPIIPPSIREAREYFFKKIRLFATDAARDGKHTVDYLAFAQEWNKTADGKTRHYITTEVLIAYTKSWKKAKQYSRIAGADFKTARESVQPSKGVLDPSENGVIPHSISTDLAMSRPRDIFETMPDAGDFDYAPSEPVSSAAATGQPNSSHEGSSGALGCNFTTTNQGSDL
ncbi:hypothetical protein B0H17DRAFT_1142779 [Mycena rosella]|uniref:3'-5' exonuclease n=1 Tax=Mycena rosella TaxID=1033263 RepID=A0AAD7G7N1_MYCRO|nr:hypothetical protein B0H17DRAFT_1142779 [Mycena rosella]